VIIVGGGGMLLPSGAPLRIILVSQIMNGVLLPFALVFMLVLVIRAGIMGEFTNGRGDRRPHDPHGRDELAAGSGRPLAERPLVRRSGKRPWTTAPAPLTRRCVRALLYWPLPPAQFGPGCPSARAFQPRAPGVAPT